MSGYHDDNVAFRKIYFSEIGYCYKHFYKLVDVTRIDLLSQQCSSLGLTTQFYVFKCDICGDVQHVQRFDLIKRILGVSES